MYSDVCIVYVCSRFVFSVCIQCVQVVSHILIRDHFCQFCFKCDEILILCASVVVRAQWLINFGNIYLSLWRRHKDQRTASLIPRPCGTRNRGQWIASLIPRPCGTWNRGQWIANLIPRPCGQLVLLFTRLNHSQVVSKSHIVWCVCVQCGHVCGVYAAAARCCVCTPLHTTCVIVYTSWCNLCKPLTSMAPGNLLQLCVL